VCCSAVGSTRRTRAAWIGPRSWAAGKFGIELPQNQKGRRDETIGLEADVRKSWAGGRHQRRSSDRRNRFAKTAAEPIRFGFHAGDDLGAAIVHSKHLGIDPIKPNPFQRSGGQIHLCVRDGRAIAKPLRGGASRGRLLRASNNHAWLLAFFIRGLHKSRGGHDKARRPVRPPSPV